MSHKNRKNNFSNGPPSNNPPSSSQDTSAPSYNQSYKPQAPPSSQNPNFFPMFPPHNMHNAPGSFQDQFPIASSAEQQQNLQANYSSAMNFMNYFSQGQLPPQNNQPLMPPSRVSTPIETQQLPYGNYYNVAQGFSFPQGYQPPVPSQMAQQRDPNIPVTVSSLIRGTEERMDEENTQAPQVERV